MNYYKNLALTSLVALPVLLVTACGSADSGSEEASVQSDNPIARLLAEGHAVFGIFSGDHTAAQGAVMAANRELDFVFYSLESGPFDIPTMQSYMGGLSSGAADADPHPLALRIPPIGEEEAQAREHIREALGAGVDAIVFPHVQTADHARLAVDALGDRLWPGNPSGDLVNMLIVEDIPGIEHVREIVMTEGVSIVFAGPGDLRRAYERDMEAVENAIQTVLAACKEFNVPCGITAGVDDIATRLEQGFRVIIVTQPEALAAGRVASGRASE